MPRKPAKPKTVRAFPAFAIYASFGEDDPDALVLETGDLCFVSTEELANEAVSVIDDDGEDEKSPFHGFKQSLYATGKEFDIDTRPVLLADADKIFTTMDQVKERFATQCPSNGDSDNEDDSDDEEEDDDFEDDDSDDE